MIDIHNHSLFSHDSTEDPERSIKTAISLKGRVFGISDHVNLFPSTNLEEEKEKLIKCQTLMNELRNKYKEQITYIFGYEFNFYRGQDERYQDIENNVEFDYIINSVHTIGTDTFYRPGYMDGKNPREVAKEYLDEVILSLHAKYDYQILGHLGQVSKVFSSEYKNLEYNDFPKEFDYILNYIIQNGKALEINTNFDGINVFPHVSVLQRYYELGGRIITLGGDAHVAERVYRFNDVGIKIAKSIGFTSVSYYENKIRKEVKI